MLKILPNNGLEFEGQVINLGGDSLPGFLLTNLSESVTLAPGVTVMDLLHLFFSLKDFVTDYCCEDYFTVNAVFSALEMDGSNDFNCVIGRKELIVSHQNELMQPILTKFTTLEGKSRVKMFRDLEVQLSSVVEMKDHEGVVIKGDLNQSFSLLELVSLFFEELYYIASNTSEDLTLVKM